jgi:hypothetical protein
MVVVKHKNSVKNISLYHSITLFFFKYWSSFVRYFIYNIPIVKFMHSPYHTEHYRKLIYYTHNTRLHFSLMHF